MNMTAKSRYALKIMMDLSEQALGDKDEMQKRHQIASRQGIPLDFMDHILAKLKDKGLILCHRGRSGGVSLGRDPEKISLWDIFSSVEESIYPVLCVESSCGAEDSCISHDAWSQVYQTIRTAFQGQTLAQVVQKWHRKTKIPWTGDPNRECRGSQPQ
jgi:Rrf2 family iron-sulfur cluster assembly transcriptional regulator